MVSESNLRPLSDFLIEKAKNELNEHQETRMQAIQDLKAAYKAKYPNLPLKREDDLFIIRFLRARKYNPERALEILYNYHHFLETNPEMNMVGVQEDFEPLLRSELLGVLSCKSRSGATVIYLQACNMDPDKITPEEMQKGFGYMWDNIMEDEAAQICGVAMLEDFKDFSLSRARKMQGKQMTSDKDMYYFLQNCLPLRLKTINFVNQPWWAGFFISIAKVFMSQKLKERFHFCGSDFKQLDEQYHLELLPTQVGGGVKFNFHSTLDTFELWRTRKVIDV